MSPELETVQAEVSVKPQQCIDITAPVEVLRLKAFKILMDLHRMLVKQMSAGLNAREHHLNQRLG